MLGALRRLLNKPKAGDSSPLAVFYYCDHAVNQQMEELNHLMRTTPDNLGRRSVLIRHLKEAQHNLMNVIMSVVHEAIPDEVAPRDFRVKYPDDVLLDQINGPIWFGAECIAAGSHIANHEAESTELRPYAIQLSKCIAKVRLALKERCLASKTAYPQKLKDTLLWFDGLWADFEFRYVSLMCTVKTEEQYYKQQDVVVLFCESTIRAMKKKYLSHDMIEMMDPVAMFAIPRLAIVCGLVVYPDGPLNTSQTHRDMPTFFRSYRQLLSRIKELLGYLSEEQFTTLEQALCSAEGLGTLNRGQTKPLPKSLKARIPLPPSTSTPARPVSSPFADASTSVSVEVTVREEQPGRSEAPEHSTSTHQQMRSYDLDSRNSTRTIFEPEPVTTMHNNRTSTPTVGIATIEYHEESETRFPHLGVQHPVVNNLPSSSNHSDNSSSRSATQVQDRSGNTNTNGELSHEIPQAPCEASQESCTKQRQRSTQAHRKAPHGKRGPAGFASAEDLMHRLFVAISGVADQLQTNHAKDLRVILKHVFTVCQSEPEDVLPVHMNGDECPTGLEPCTPEPQSPLITATSASQRFNFPAATGLSIEDYPQWVPDADSPVCSSCQERFSWKKRRHHCRNCGRVVCSRCSPNTLPLPKYTVQKSVRVCTNCYIQHLGQAARMTVQRFSQSMQVY